MKHWAGKFGLGLIIVLGLGAATIAYLGRSVPAVTETLPVPNGFPPHSSG